VLVEGEDDVAAIQGTAKSLGVSLDAFGISVVPVGGKNSLDRPELVFKALGIPTYLVWDSDKQKPEENTVNTNRRLLRIVGEAEEDYPCAVKDQFACFDDKLETTLKNELGEHTFTTIIGELQKEFDVASNLDCLKRPALFSELIVRAKAKDRRSNTMERIVEKITAMRQI
jgi:putative ATP-dependent endonuclease of the OLD family